MRRRTARGRWGAGALIALGVGLLASLLVPVPAGAEGGAGRRAVPPARDPAVVARWARTADETVRREVGGTPPDRTFWSAYVSLAMYNAVTGIEGRYAPYKWSGHGPRTASSAAAAAAAAHRLLRHCFPSSAPGLDAALAVSLARIPDDPGRREGVAFGERAADHFLALRGDDGRGATVPFALPPVPGAWQPTPPRYELFGNAWLGRMRPLLLETPGQFRPGPPPSLTSARYAADLNEVKEYGGRDNSRRTPRQTDTARYFTDLDLPSAYGDHAARHHLDIVDTARLYAVADSVQADGVVAAFDAKLRHGTWRPVTAIHRADEDGNPATRPDPGWKSLLITPAHPDHLSGHATTAGALSRALTRILGSPRIDLNVRSLVSGTTRHYEVADQYDRDSVDARVFGGIHTRTADVVGNRTGHRLADWALDRYFRPLRRSVQGPQDLVFRRVGN